MKLKKMLIGIALLAVLLIITTFSLKQPHHNGSKQTIIRVGYMDWVGFYPFLLAIKKGKFNDKDYTISIVKAKDNLELNSLISTGKIDLCFSAFADHVYMKGNGIKIKFIYATDFSKSDVIVASADIKSIKDLANKIISVTDLNSFSEFFVLTSLAAANVDSKTTSIKVIDFDKVIQSIDSKAIHAGHTWDPETPKALKKGLKVIASSADIKGVVIDGLIATEDILESHKIQVSDILSEIDSELNSIKNITNEDINYLAEHFDIPKENIPLVIKNGVEFLDLKENQLLFESTEEYSFTYWTNKVSSFYSSRGQLNRSINPKDLLDSTPIKLARSKGGL